jgi:Rrf2 family protein
MLVSLQADYALRVLLDVAVNQASGKAVVTREIAERQYVPRVFLTKIVAQLANRGMLHTMRGKGGGVTLGMAPEDIVLLDVIEAFEGSLMFNQCTADPGYCQRSPGCTIRGFWKAAELHLKNFFRNRTVADLLSLSIEDRDEVFAGMQNVESFATMSSNGRDQGKRSRCITPEMAKRALRKGE